MKALFVAHSSWRGYSTTGGAETMAADLMEYLASVGWDASASFVGRGREERDVNGVTVHRRKADTDLFDLARDTDIILTHLGATPMAKRLGKKFGKPVVQLVHNTNEFTDAFLGSGCDFVIYNALWVREHHQTRKSQLLREWVNEKKSVIKPRVMNEWPSVLVRPPATEKQTFGGNPEGVVTLVNLTPNKGPDVFYELAEAYPDVQFMGVIGGYERDAQVIKNLSNVSIHPHVADVSEFYSKVSVVLVPSIYESYGRVAVEAMARGIPVVAASTPGLKECLGPTVPTHERTPEAFGKALESTFVHYSARSCIASARYQELYEQTKADLANFDQAMKDVASGRFDHYY